MKCLATTIAIIFSNYAFAGILDYQQQIDCGISGCEVVCYSSRGGLIFSSRGREVIITYLPNGATVFEVRSTMNRSDTIVAGGNGYLCKVKDHR